MTESSTVTDDVAYFQDLSRQLRELKPLLGGGEVKACAALTGDIGAHYLRPDAEPGHGCLCGEVTRAGHDGCDTGAGQP